MENMTIEEKADEYIKQYLPHVDTTGHWLGFQDGYRQALAEYSGSVSTPKEEETKGEMHLRHKLELGKEIDVLRQQLKEREKLIQELIMSNEKFVWHYTFGGSQKETVLNAKAIIERARKTLSK